MKPLQTNLSIYKKFNFEHQPVGVKFLSHKPEGIEQLDRNMALCEMMKEAQERGTPFYIDKDNEDCNGRVILGMAEPPPFLDLGALTEKWGIFDEARVNDRLIEYSPMMPPGRVNYVVFSPLEKLNFDPDLLFLTTTTSQAEVVLRAMSYSTGEMWSNRFTSGGACAFLFAYPYLSGKVNYLITGLTLGLKGRNVFPEGWFLFSIPYNWIPIITRSLERMNWLLPGYADKNREAFLAHKARIFEELAQEFEKP